MKVIDATNLILGRLATKVAKLALEGEKISIINSEKAVISGKKKMVLARFKDIREKGDPFHGPFYPRMPDRIVKRAIRGMLPYKKERGKKAYKNIKCYIGIPLNLKDAKSETIKRASISKTTAKFIYVGEISKLLGAKL